MNSVLDGFLVGLALSISFGYAIYSLGPKSLRPRASAGAASLIGRLPAVFGLRGLVQRLAMAATRQSKAPCSGCANCGSDDPPITESSTTATEVAIPLAKIGKRRIAR